MAADLSTHSKRTFQVVAFFATVMVVGIHYKTDVPDTPNVADATWNELLQEYLLGGLSRVAVPLFALASGLFYFRSDTGSFSCYRRKLTQRCRTLLLPYFIVGSFAIVFWLLTRNLRSESVEMDLWQFLSAWLLRPSAEQLWFLRDLLVLVAFAPPIGRLTESTGRALATISLIGSMWLLNVQCFPTIAGWHLVQMETLLFFCVGAVLARRCDVVNAVSRIPVSVGLGLTVLWCSLVAIRVWLRADFDIWYRADYAFSDLIVHQLSILVGCPTLFWIASRCDSVRLQRVSSVSFFVFLVHEYPLRAVVKSIAQRVMGLPFSCWVIFPAVTLACYLVGLWMGDRFPDVFAVLTGGRTPKRAERIARSEASSTGKDSIASARSANGGVQ